MEKFVGGVLAGLVEGSSAVATRRPAAPARAFAVANDRPVSWGMRKACGVADAGWLTRRLTRGRSTPEALGGGVCASTMPGSPGAEMAATVPTSSEERRSAREAGRSVWPVTSGTETCWDPMLSVTRMAHSLRTIAPGAGNWPRMCPEGMSAE